MDYPQPTQLARPTSTGRINWTQTTTMTVAAFIGCLLALTAGLMLYRHLVAKAVRAETARLDQLRLTCQQQESALNDVVQQRKQLQTKSVKTATEEKPTDDNKAEPKEPGSSEEEAD
ncbi:hypothetical protein [Spirosoma pomorum]